MTCENKGIDNSCMKLVPSPLYQHCGDAIVGRTMNRVDQSNGCRLCGWLGGVEREGTRFAQTYVL
jgi:hypothetical protein